MAFFSQIGGAPSPAPSGPLAALASGDPRLAGAIVEVDSASGRAASIRRIMLDEAGLAGLPAVADDPSRPRNETE